MEVTILIAFIKNHTLENIKHKLLILYLLNVTDILFTLLLISTGLFMEANIVLKKAVQSVPASILLKVVLPAVLLFYISLRIKDASVKQLKQSNIILTIVTVGYTLINISHLVYISFYVLFI